MGVVLSLWVLGTTGDRSGAWVHRGRPGVWDTGVGPETWVQGSGPGAWVS